MFNTFRESQDWRLPAAVGSLTLLSALLASVLLQSGFEIGKMVDASKEIEENVEEQNEQNENESHDSDSGRNYSGLRNLGNTCYLNSLLQALSGSTHYMKFAQNIIKNDLIKLSSDEEDETCNEILYHFIKVLLQLCYNVPTADAYDLYNLICSDTRLFRIYEQCDAHELNLYIQDKLITHIPPSARRSLREREAISILTDESSFPSGPSSLKLLSHLERESIQHGLNPMLTQMSVTLECQDCSLNSCPPTFRIDSQLDINLDLPQSVPGRQGPAVSVQDLIAASFAPTQIEGFKCMRCSLRRYLMRFANVTKPSDLMSQPKITWNFQCVPPHLVDQMRDALDLFVQLYRHPDLDQDKFTAAVKAFKERTGNTVKHNFPSIVVGVTQTRKIIRAPKLLCLHLNRLAYDSYGNVFINHSLVPFQEELTLSSDRVLSFDMAIKYRLAAVIEHSGSVMGGHYIAFKRITCPISRTDQDKFLMCNDERTQPIAVADVLRRKAFMIFYEQA